MVLPDERGDRQPRDRGILAASSQPRDPRTRGRLVVISGPSGAGKSTIVRSLLDRLPFRFSVSMTTRHRRPGEVDGQHYHFVSRDTFRASIEEDDLLEWAEYGGHLYGTPRQPVDRWRAAGEDVLLEIEIQGARQVRENDRTAMLVFIVPPTMDELERRLRGRGDTAGSDIDRRLDIAADEMTEAPALVDAVVVNDEVTRATEEIVAFLGAG